ncbi:protein far1-related sequence 5-like [Gigaspora margarita]|uniref:Protein far1-related sequence 5-like n=1 Tax=Gigaspora margarita TaxID=4874 RepID=A0A8H4EN61_GIGMA|nr:protein far1-related sequence 5-like [Gigaspora margarita]
MNNKRSISEIYLEEETVDNNESQESKCENINAAKRQVQNHAIEVGFELYRRLNPEMLNQVKFLVNIGCEASMIIHELQKNFLNTIIYPKNIYNAIHLFKCNEQLVKTNASEIYRKLIQLQREETGWFVEPWLEGKDNHLTGLF